ncbi:hypothetical protein EDC01DRAFT_659618 [Geopyxis carbonaria]|nr:hypothetical protein EDC01DRAFT_659618 [Geopyxis carbonaria]
MHPLFPRACKVRARRGLGPSMVQYMSVPPAQGDVCGNRCRLSGLGCVFGMEGFCLSLALPGICDVRRKVRWSVLSFFFYDARNLRFVDVDVEFWAEGARRSAGISAGRSMEREKPAPLALLAAGRTSLSHFPLGHHFQTVCAEMAHTHPTHTQPSHPSPRRAAAAPRRLSEILTRCVAR